MSDMKPKWPQCSGAQYARDSMTPEELSVSYDAFNNEIAADRPMHDNSTPSHGSFNFGGGQYSDDFKGGWSGYGVAVNGAPSASRENTTVAAESTERGKES